MRAANFFRAFALLLLAAGIGAALHYGRLLDAAQVDARPSHGDLAAQDPVVGL